MEYVTAVIRVEQEHIDNGIKGNCSSCPWALALLDVFPTAEIVIVTGPSIKVVFGEYSLQWFESYHDLIRWIERYDYGNTCYPETYILRFEVRRDHHYS